MDNKQWKRALIEAEYQYYSTDKEFKRHGDGIYSDILCSNWRPSMGVLSNFGYKYEKPSERVSTILDLITNFRCNNFDKIVIALNPNDILDYDFLAQQINDGIQRMSCNNRRQVYIHNIRKKDGDINTSKLLGSQYVIVPDDNFEIYDALIGMRDVCKNEIGLIIDEPKSNMIRVKNSIMTEINRLCSVVKINFHERRKVYITGDTNTIIRVLEEIDNRIYRQKYEVNGIQMRHGMDTMKEGILKGPLFFSEVMCIPNDKFEHGQLKYKVGLLTEVPTNRCYSLIKIGIEYIPDEEIKLRENEEVIESTKSTNEELEDIRKELIKEYRELTTYSKDNFSDREQITRMIKNITDSLK